MVEGARANNNPLQSGSPACGAPFHLRLRRGGKKPELVTARWLPPYKCCFSPKRQLPIKNSCGARHSRLSAVTCRPRRPSRLAWLRHRRRFGDSASRNGANRIVASHQPQLFCALSRATRAVAPTSSFVIWINRKEYNSLCHSDQYKGNRRGID